MNKTTEYVKRELVDKYIDENYNSIFLKNPSAEYIASVPKNLDNPNEEEFYLELGSVSKNTEDFFDSLKHQNFISKGINPHIKSESVLVDPFQLQEHYERERPLKQGINIGNKSNYSGTLGALIKLHGFNDEIFILSNHHVLTGFNFDKNRLISQPHRDNLSYGFNREDVIAQVKFGHYGKYIDVAFAKLLDVPYYKSRTYINNINAPQGIETDTNIKIGESVYKIGAMTGKSSGKIKSKNAYFRFNASSSSNKPITLKKQLLLTNMSKPGDSGSIVVNSYSKKAVGLIMGGDSNNYTIANQFKFIFHDSYGQYPNLPPLKFKSFV